MYKQLLTKPVHRPAIIAGVLMALLSALLNPMSMTYVCYTSLRLGGSGLRWAVFMSSISMAGAYAVGEWIVCVMQLICEQAHCARDMRAHLLHNLSVEFCRLQMVLVQ
jgi:hypothetical protein